MESSTLLPKSQRNHMFPIKCIHEPCRNMELSRCKYCRPGSVVQTRPWPIGNAVPTGTAAVISAGISPSSQTDFASGNSAPAPWTKSQTNTFRPVSYTHLRAHETPEHLVCRLL